MKYRESIDFVYYMLLRSLRSLFFCLPRRLCLLLGEGVGALLFRLDGRHRRIALINLEKALGSSLSAAERRCIARKSFAHFGRVLADDLKWAHLRQDAKRKLLHVEGKENVRRALEQGNGALLFSAHFGNWEVASLALSQLGPLSVVARPL
ncbi:MAG: hypothetical protein FJY81_06095, partial [Candidatus Aminicenantes bacterium]|nr:hypothetical protein [Candidatus Aminicenantes bacterium]